MSIVSLYSLLSSTAYPFMLEIESNLPVVPRGLVAFVSYHQSHHTRVKVTQKYRVKMEISMYQTVKKESVMLLQTVHLNP